MHTAEPTVHQTLSSSGGTVAIFARADQESDVRAMAGDYERITGRRAEVFAGSGSGMRIEGQ